MADQPKVLTYESPRPAKRPRRSLLTCVLLGSFFLGLAAAGAITVLLVTAIVFLQSRSELRQVEGVALWVVTLITLCPPTFMAGFVAIRLLIVEPFQMRRDRS
jgi:hypothetical protein